MISEALLPQMKSFSSFNSASQGDSIYQSGSYDVSFGGFLLGQGEFNLADLESIRLYIQCLPFAQAVDMRASAFANLTFKIWDRKKKAFADEQNHPILDLLRNPNSDQTGEEFMIAYSAYADITGNSYLTVTAMGDTSTPLELFNELPYEVTPQPSTSRGTQGFTGLFRVNNPFAGQTVYTLNDTGARFRYFDDNGGEIWQVRSFNPFRGGNNLRGMSRAQSLWLEIQQYIEGNRTNHSSLINGVRPSGVFTNLGGKPLTEVQWGRLQEMVKKYTGSQGAGKAYAADGIDFKPIQITNRDQEYSKLQQSMYEKIFTRYDVPLPLISSAAQTYVNLSTAMFQFYETGVSPHARKLLSEISLFLMPRYPNSENLEVRFDRADVDALTLRAFEEGKEMRAIAVNSDNEIRTKLGYEEIPITGDIVYKPSLLSPAGVDADTRGNDVDPPNVVPGKFLEAILATKNQETGELYTLAEARKAWENTED